MRKILGLALAGLIVLASHPAEAQKATKLPRVAYLALSVNVSVNYENFRNGLRELGYVEGKNIVLEYRTAESSSGLDALAIELVQQKVDIIVAQGLAAQAAKLATQKIPVVFAASGEPIEAGLVESLARPGGNLTGITLLAFDLVGKRLELLKEAVPKVSRVAVVAYPWHAGQKREFEQTQMTARHLGLDLQYLPVKSSGDYDGVFEAISKGSSNALLVFPDALSNSNRRRIVEFAAKARIPGVYGWREYVEVGGLMSYGPNQDTAYRRLAVYVDKILKGAKPADLPVELPTKFEFAINLKAAQQIGLTIPPNVLARADRVIK